MPLDLLGLQRRSQVRVCTAVLYLWTSTKMEKGNAHSISFILLSLRHVAAFLFYLVGAFGDALAYVKLSDGLSCALLLLIIIIITTLFEKIRLPHISLAAES